MLQDHSTRRLPHIHISKQAKHRGKETGWPGRARHGFNCWTYGCMQRGMGCLHTSHTCKTAASLCVSSCVTRMLVANSRGCVCGYSSCLRRFRLLLFNWQVMHSGTMSNKLIGQARLTMVEIAQAGESLTKWLPLLDDRRGLGIVGWQDKGETKRSCRGHSLSRATSSLRVPPLLYLKTRQGIKN